MFVTQKRSAAASDPERRQSKMCCKSVYTRLLCMLLTIAVMVSAMIVPANAADSELLYQDILPAGVYTKYEDEVKVSSPVSPTSHFEGVTSCGFMWDARPYEHTFQSFVFTLRISGTPVPSRVTFSHYTGRVVEAELIAREGEYFQYRVDFTSNLAWVTITAYFDEPFTGTFGIYSCIGIRDIGFNIKNVDWYEYVSMVPAGSTVLTQKSVKSAVGDPLPVGHISKRTDSLQTWFYDKIYIKGDFDNFDVLQGLTFIGSGQLPDAVTFSILDKKTETPVHIIELTETAARYSTSAPSWGENAWQYYVYQLDVDLNGYDLEGCVWELSFTVEPSSYNSTMSFTSWMLNSILARLPVAETPWYKVFWNWVSNKWDSVAADTNSHLNQIISAIKNSNTGSAALNKQLNDAGKSMSQQAKEFGKANDQLESVDRPSISPDNLFSGMLDFNPAGLSMLAVLTNNSQITAMLVVVFTFALCGYIFFGKKG